MTERIKPRDIVIIDTPSPTLREEWVERFQWEQGTLYYVSGVAADGVILFVHRGDGELFPIAEDNCMKVHHLGHDLNVGDSVEKAQETVLGRREKGKVKAFDGASAVIVGVQGHYEGKPFHHRHWRKVDLSTNAAAAHLLEGSPSIESKADSDFKKVYGRSARGYSRAIQQSLYGEPIGESLRPPPNYDTNSHAPSIEQEEPRPRGYRAQRVHEMLQELSRTRASETLPNTPSPPSPIERQDAVDRIVNNDAPSLYSIRYARND